MFQEFISLALREPPAVISYHVSCRLAALFPDRAMIEGTDCDFSLQSFADAGQCQIKTEESVHPQYVTSWNRDQSVEQRPKNVWFEVEWDGHQIDVLLLSWDEYDTVNYWILAETNRLARAFFATVCAWEEEVEDRILVYDNGGWNASSTLYKSIVKSRLEELILPGDTKAQIVGDLRQFFDSRETYDRLGVPWRRGVLLTGPPGNGKTHFIKALANTLDIPCLYVKSLKGRYDNDHINIRAIFDRARRVAPCMLVLEDLDALAVEENRSFLLNELDGFASNAGILTVATTNHPGKLDPALLDRPSRFDRKYNFGLPGPTERDRYFGGWATQLPSDYVLSDHVRAELVTLTESFSFAYLKELFLSTMTAIASAPEKTLDQVVIDVAELLRRQLGKTPLRREISTTESPKPSGSDPRDQQTSECSVSQTR